MLWLTIFTVPGPPGDIRKLLVEEDSVMLYWCGADQRRLPLQYALMVWRGSKVTRKFTLNDPFYRVRGLDSNTQYLFSVQAVNKVGMGTDKNITVTTLPRSKCTNTQHDHTSLFTTY